MKNCYTFALPEDVCVEYGQVKACIESPVETGSSDGMTFQISDILQDNESAVVLGISTRIEGDSHIKTVCRAQTEDGISFINQQNLFTLPDPDHKWLAGNVIAVSDQRCIAMICDMGRPPTSGHRFHVFTGNIDGSDWHQANSEPVYKGQDSFSLRWDGRQIVNYATSYQNYSKRFPDNMGGQIRRVFHIRTSPDGLTWTPGGSFGVDGPLLPDDQLIVPDEKDPEETEFYKFSTFTYCGFHVGIMVKYISQPQEVPGLEGWPHGPMLSAEYWISRDGFTWLRPYDRNDARLESLPRSFNYSLTQPYITPHRLRWNRGQRVLDVPRYRLLGIGCRANASVITPPLHLSGTPLRLHVSFQSEQRRRQDMFRQGYVMVDLLDQNQQIIPGFEGKECMFTDYRATILNLCWENQDLSSIAVNQPVYCRIRFRDARIHTLEGATEINN